MNKPSLPLQFTSNVEKQPNKVAITFLDEKNQGTDITYLELMKKINGVSQAIVENTKPGDCVLLIYSPGINFIVAFFACLHTGRLAVPAYPPANPSSIARLETIIQNAKPPLVLSEAAIFKTLEKVSYLRYVPFQKLKKVALKKFHVPEKVGLLFSNIKHMIATDTLELDDFSYDFNKLNGNAFIQYTSGTTSNPKGVVISHANIAENLNLICSIFKIRDESKVLIWLPPYHDMGLIGGILAPLYYQNPVVLTSPFNFIKNPYMWLELIDKYKANISGGPNFAYGLCVKRAKNKNIEALDLSSWDIAFCGAEPINANTLQQFCDTFKSCGFREKSLLPCYGNAESTLIVSSTEAGKPLNVVQLSRESLSEGQVRFVSGGDAIQFVDCGKPLQNVAILEPQSGAILGENQVGEVLINGSSVATGYWNDNERTKETFKVAANGERYYHSGDLGFLSNGRLYITGRIKDLIIVGGRNYYAHELEAAIQNSCADIRSGCCIAYESTENGASNLRVVIEIKYKDNAACAELVQDVLAHINASFGIAPEAVYLVKPRTILRTTSGKIQRYQTAHLVETTPDVVLFKYKVAGEEDFLANPTTPKTRVARQTNPQELQAAIEKTFLELISKNYPQETKIDANSKIDSLGLDSILYLKLMTILQNQLAIDFDLNELDIQKDQTIKELAKEIAIHSQFPERITCLDDLPAIKRMTTMHANLAKGGYDKLFMRAFEGASNAVIPLDGKPYLNFACYNYLGLSVNSELKEFVKSKVDQYGSSVSASRLVAGNRDLTEELETALAEFVGLPSAIIFTAGYQTVLTTITHLFGPRDAIIYDELAHNSSLLGSLYSGADLYTFKHNNAQSLKAQLKKIVGQYDKMLIITEGVFSMDGDIAPLDKIIALKKQFGCFLMVDEAHSLGVIGKTGRGLAEYFNQTPKDVDIIVGTLSKAFASCGGFVCGSELLVQYLKATAPGFVFSAGITPANTAAALAALTLLKKNPKLLEQMQKNADYFVSKLKEMGLNTGQSEHTPIVPIIIGDSKRTLEISRQLFENGIYAPPIIAPGVTENQARIRFFITALHEKKQFDKCLKVLKELQAKGLLLPG